MKTILLKIAITCTLILGFKHQLHAQEVIKGAQITFEKDMHDFNEVPMGGNTTYTFEFKNTGTEPLIINQVRWSCSCQLAEWPKEPILPGKSGLIKVRYDSNRVGPINKSFTVFSNAMNEPSKNLFIKGKVLQEEAVSPAVMN